MEIVLALLVLFAALVALAYPLYRARPQASEISAVTLDDLISQRDGVYATLRDLELDHQLGKLDESDYLSLRTKYMARAAEILHEMDLMRGEGAAAGASAEIEKEVAVLRGKSGTTVVPQSQQNARRNQDEAQAELRCSNCGRPYRDGDKFCAQCGKELGQVLNSY